MKTIIIIGLSLFSYSFIHGMQRNADYSFPLPLVKTFLKDENKRILEYTKIKQQAKVKKDSIKKTKIINVVNLKWLKECYRFPLKFFLDWAESREKYLYKNKYDITRSISRLNHSKKKTILELIYNRLDDLAWNENNSANHQHQETLDDFYKWLVETGLKFNSKTSKSNKKFKLLDELEKKLNTNKAFNEK